MFHMESPYCIIKWRSCGYMKVLFIKTDTLSVLFFFPSVETKHLVVIIWLFVCFTFFVSWGKFPDKIYCTPATSVCCINHLNFLPARAIGCFFFALSSQKFPLSLSTTWLMDNCSGSCWCLCCCSLKAAMDSSLLDWCTAQINSLSAMMMLLEA